MKRSQPSQNHDSKSETDSPDAGCSSLSNPTAHTPPTAADQSPDRRKFLGAAATAVAVGGAGLASQPTKAKGQTATQTSSDLFQPEEYWKDRMQAPDDLSLIHI